MDNKENQRYGRNKQTLINNSYINSGAYRKKFDTITSSSIVNRVLYTKAKEILAHRSGTLYEDMYWIDENTGHVIASVTNSAKEQVIVYPKSIQNSIQKRSSLITLHNHPASMPPSVPDLNSTFVHSYRLGLIICHDGKIFAYRAHEFIHEKLAELYIAEFLDNGYNEYEAQLRMLRKFQEQGFIHFWEVAGNER